MTFTSVSQSRMWIVGPMMLLATSCGPMISHLKEASITPSGQMAVTNPLKVDRATAQRIGTIAVPYFASKEQFKTTDDWRLYRAQVDVVVEEVKKVRGLQVITLSVQKQKDLGLFVDPSELVEDEQIEHAKKLGGAVHADAVLAFSNKAQKVNMGKAFGSMLFAGTIDVPLTMAITLVSSATGHVIYEQEQNVTLTTGSMVITNTPDADLKEMVRPVIRPLVADLAAGLSRP